MGRWGREGGREGMRMGGTVGKGGGEGEGSLHHGGVAPGGEGLGALLDGLLRDELGQVEGPSGLVVGTWNR